jgi:hypothetical protein
VGEGFLALDLLPFLLEDLVVAFVGVALVLTACFGLEGLAIEVEAASGLRVSDTAAENGGLVLVTPVIEDGDVDEAEDAEEVAVDPGAPPAVPPNLRGEGTGGEEAGGNSWVRCVWKVRCLICPAIEPPHLAAKALWFELMSSFTFAELLSSTVIILGSHAGDFRVLI